MLSVRGNRELQAAVKAMKAADRALRSDINRETVQVGNEIWRPAVANHVRTKMDNRILNKGVRVKGGNPPQALAANSRAKLGKGSSKRLSANDLWPMYEFGANREKVKSYDRTSVNGKKHKVTRHTARQLPPRIQAGRVVFPAYAEVAPRMITYWLKAIVAKYNDRIEGK